MTTNIQLIAEAMQVAAEQRILDARRVRIAGELASRSVPSLGSEGMSRCAGYARPALMLADLWKITVAEAQRLCDVGLAVRPRTALDGTELPSRYPAVAAAVDSGSLGVESAAVIVHELEAASLRCSDDARHRAERELVTRADDFSVVDLHAIARHLRDRLDQDGAEPRDELRRTKRSLRLVSRRDGMTRLEWEMPPETAGLVKAGIDAIVSDHLRRERDEAASTERTLEQRRADAAELVFHHVASCSNPAGDLPTITMVVRMTLESLVEGLGAASIDGQTETISASTARRLAAEVELIPLVLGGRSESLDIGRARRLFTRAQKLAMAERDEGCAFPGCTSPPSFAEAHHIEWWSDGGGTDLSNGVLLCAFHHHRVHDDGWQIELRDHVPYFIPPPWADPSRAPRRGGRVLLEDAA
jgi:hypothetical protein